MDLTALMTSCKPSGFYLELATVETDNEATGMFQPLNQNIILTPKLTGFSKKNVNIGGNKRLVAKQSERVNMQAQLFGSA